MEKVLLILLTGLIFLRCDSKQRVDLAITNASLFNLHSKDVELNKVVIVDKEEIIKIPENRHLENILSDTTIDAACDLLTPGFIDVHFH